MPYIKKEERNKYDKFLSQCPEIETKGDLEYLVYKLALKYMSTRERRYNTLHDAVYAIIHSAEEFKRRNLDIRENEAIKENGDITL